MADQPACRGQLAETLPVSRPAVSQHLKVLKEPGLVARPAVGTRRIYQVDPDGLAALRDYLDGFWNRSLAAFKRAAEEPTRRTDDPDNEPHTARADLASSSRCPIERAFRVFTAEIDTWWNPDHHIIEAPLQRHGLRAAGRRSRLRHRHRRQRVPLVAGARLRAARAGWCSAGTSTCSGSWRPTRTGPARSRCASSPRDRTRTLVELEHRHLDRHGEGWEQMWTAVGSTGGWEGGLSLFARAVGRG